MGGYAHHIDFNLEYESADLARVIYRSVAQEIGEIDDDRSETAVTMDGNAVQLSIDAADLVALRAASNTWLSLIEVAEDTAAIGE